MKEIPELRNTVLLKMLRVLNSREAAKIHFTAFGVEIKGEIFGSIARELGFVIIENIFSDITNFFSPNTIANNAPRLHVTVVDKFDKKGITGGYKPSNKNLLFRWEYFGSRVFETIIIHESVHAWLDKINAPVSRVENEAIAYIAEHLYSRFVGLGLHRINSDPIHPIAQTVANLILHKKQPSQHLLDRLTNRIKISYAN